MSKTAADVRDGLGTPRPISRPKLRLTGLRGQNTLFRSESFPKPLKSRSESET